MKRLEDFIKENRRDFDTYEPGDKVWNNLESQFSQKQSKSFKDHAFKWITLSAVAASLFFIILLFNNKAETNNNANSGVEINNSTLPDEYAEEVDLFTRLIQIKHRDLNQIKREEPELYSKFSTDIRRLDSNYHQLKRELPGNPNENMILDAMINNLQLQMELLDQQLLIIQKIKQSKKENNEKHYKST